jgi:hypothetical protein
LKSEKALQADKAIAHVAGVYRARFCIMLRKGHTWPYSAPRIMHSQTDEDPVGNGDQTSDCQRSLGLATEQRAGRRNDKAAETRRSQVRQHSGAVVGTGNCATNDRWGDGAKAVGRSAERASDEACDDGGDEQ